MHFTRLNRPTKSELYDSYWKFTVRRHDIFQKRLINPIGPWTNDPILKKHRFTNVFRALDRVTQYLIKIQNEEGSLGDIFFKTMLFKFFNKIETYRFLERELKIINKDSFVLREYDELLTARMSLKYKIYSAAYIMPSAGHTFGHKLKHSNHLALLFQMLQDNLHGKIQECNTMEEVYNLLLSYPSLGKFLAFQYTIDLNYSCLTNFSEMDFVVAGPGAINGIKKCFSSLGDYNYEDIIKMMADEQEDECRRLELEPPTLWGRPLQLIDCQNLFCETDKYLRGTNPSTISAGGQKRIKQNFSVNSEPLTLLFPPKWEINKSYTQSCQRPVIADIFS